MLKYLVIDFIVSFSDSSILADSQNNSSSKRYKSILKKSEELNPYTNSNSNDERQSSHSGEHMLRKTITQPLKKRHMLNKYEHFNIFFALSLILILKTPNYSSEYVSFLS